jgi:son of sevenless-like protein
VIANPEEVLEDQLNGLGGDADDEEVEEEDEDTEDYEDQDEDEEADSERDDRRQLAMEYNSERTRADFWIPQATPDGRLFYFNTETGESSMELPLESPSSATENGPRDRMNINIPEKTRPPPEMMARGYMQDEDDESDGNSASELDGENLMLASRSSYVSSEAACLLAADADSNSHESAGHCLMAYLLRHLWIPSTACHLSLAHEPILSPIRLYPWPLPCQSWAPPQPPLQTRPLGHHMLQRCLGLSSMMARLHH